MGKVVSLDGNRGRRDIVKGVKILKFGLLISFLLVISFPCPCLLFLFGYLWRYFGGAEAEVEITLNQFPTSPRPLKNSPINIISISVARASLWIPRELEKNLQKINTVFETSAPP